MAHPIPPDEERRLAELRRYRILDTMPEREFDDLALLAGIVCGAPMAQINFVDYDRQFHKASVGAPGGSGPRSLSFCAHAIAAPQEILYVEDARHDERFARYANVTGPPGIVFYAGAPLVTHEGSSIGTVCVVDFQPRHLDAQQLEALRAISRQAVALLELRLAREAAESAAEERAQFAATVAHELRTPLNGVLGMAQALSLTRLDDEQRGLVGSLVASAEHMRFVAEQVLDVSRLDAGRAPLDAVAFAPATCAREAADMLAPLARAKDVALALASGKEAERRVVGDAARLRQVLVNLVGNAVKFTPRGGRVDVRVQATDAQGGRRVRLEVADTGPGIPPEVAARLFRDYEQGDASVQRRHGGTGLGLAISRRIVERMGGVIHLESTPGAGATFAVELTLPAADDAPVAARPHPDARTHPLRILVADDEPLNREVLRRFLGRWGYEPDLVADGGTALAALRANAYDLALLDLDMPVAGGSEVARALRAGARGERPRLVACTGHVGDDARERVHGDGFDDHLEKPVDLSRLAELVRSTTRRNG